MRFPRSVRHIRLTHTCLAILLLCAAHGVTAEVVFERIGFESGLLNSSVSSILQDSDGFLWFGTQSGLQRYDGRAMLSFTSEPFNPDSLSHQLVQTLAYDPGDALWVGTYGGINRLDPATGRMSHARHVPGRDDSLSNDVVVAVARDAAGALWVGTLDGLNRLDSASDPFGPDARFTRFAPDADDPSAIPNATIRALRADSRGLFWIGSYGGLSYVDPRTSGATAGEPRFVTLPVGNDALPSPFVMTIAEDAGGDLWIGLWDGGVVRLRVQSGVDRATGDAGAAGDAPGAFMLPDGTTVTIVERYSLPDNRVYQVLPARSGLVYVATWGGGLSVIDPRTGAVTTHRHDPADRASLAHDIAYSLFEDRSGIVWVGTNGNGISKLNPSQLDFRLVHRDLPEDRLLTTGRVQLLYEHAATGLLLVGVQNAGLNIRDPETGRVTVYRHDPDNPRSIAHDNVSTVMDDGACVLVGTNAGIDRFCVEEGTFERAWEPFHAVAPTPPIVYALLRARDGSLWVGTYDRGVLRLNPDGTVTEYRFSSDDPESLSNNLVYTIMEDREGAVWIGTNGGLNRYLPGSDGFRRYLHDPVDRRTISSNSVGALREDSAGTLWAATRSGGLARYDRDRDGFSNIDTTHGLSGNLVTSFLETAPGVLYVATTSGLNRVTLDPFRVELIDERDGLATREFASGALTTASGDHLFGGFSSIVRIPGRRDSLPGVPPQVQITSIRVMNQPYGAATLPHRVTAVDLPYTENFVEFGFAAMDFSLPLRNSYRYRLVGLDSGWVDAGHRATATYTSLRPGRYTFEVIAADSRGVWSSDPARIELTIRPPFWRTEAFAALSIVVIGVAVYLVFSLRTRSLREQARRLEATVGERTEALRVANAELRAANETKDRFFSIIAHDLRGPINGMAQLTSQVVRDSQTIDREQLLEVSSVISASAGGLVAMLENLLEWSQLQLGTLQLTAAPVAVAPIVDEVTDAHRGAMGAKSLALSVEAADDLAVLADPHGVKTVLTNLVSNAVKFSRPNGSITVRAAALGQRLTIAVVDDGVGMPPERLDALMNGRTVARSHGTSGERGTGLGLLLCRDLMARMGGTLTLQRRPEGGTVATVDLPLAVVG
ncbi:MAG: hypothetical protein EA382_06655 [Spirochaetaceae bacterium]|nr:MAG: hypothetical protein EA382_06655 [Spirochaetaceae bacterium]